ncbi:DUF2913 family protein [Pantoea sp. JK]|uniref:DUF2913 family protein n=1 Tax=Pantoea sp. JK TaxID=2871703 RepID=UPI002238936B|nr:DUF2913 family protein [Pantoea sp. JK]MCW6034461.1 DUF2913 family protein [Pantoea sp. JK]
MSSQSLYVDHLAWCGLMALSIARRNGVIRSSAQENLFLCRWLATAEKKRLFPRELASDITWRLKEGREKGLQADLPSKLEYLWRASRGDRMDQSDLFQLQHIMHAIKLTGINYGVLNESEWEGKHSVKLSQAVPGVYLRRADIDSGFNLDGKQLKKISVLITANLAAVDDLLNRAKWYRVEARNKHILHYFITEEIDVHI